MTEITLHVGGVGESSLVNLAWIDHNGVKRQNVLRVFNPNQDKPRILVLELDGEELTVLESD